MTIEVLNWGLFVSSRPPALTQVPADQDARDISASTTRQIWCNISDRWRLAAVYPRSKLTPGDGFDGPALIVEPQTTTFVSADFRADIDGYCNIWLTQKGRAAA